MNPETHSAVSAGFLGSWNPRDTPSSARPAAHSCAPTCQLEARLHDDGEAGRWAVRAALRWVGAAANGGSHEMIASEWEASQALASRENRL